MGIESHALDRFEDSEHACFADTGTVHRGHYGFSVAGVLEFMMTLSIEVERAYSQSVLVCRTRWTRFVRPSAGVEMPVRLSNYALQATPTSAEAGRSAVTPAAGIRFAGSTAGYAAVAPAPLGCRYSYGVPELDR